MPVPGGERTSAPGLLSARDKRSVRRGARPARAARIGSGTSALPLRPQVAMQSRVTVRIRSRARLSGDGDVEWEYRPGAVEGGYGHPEAALEDVGRCLCGSKDRDGRPKTVPVQRDAPPIPINLCGVMHVDWELR